MGEMTPMMKQYLEIKEQNKDNILFFRLGDFYEMFYDDARLASKELDLTLTGKDCGMEERAPMCGIPYHSSEGYIARLIQKGYKVAICEQTEDPALAKGIVKREVIRIITPGTVTDAGMLDETKNNFIASVTIEDGTAGICFADITTGEIYATQTKNKQWDKIVNELGRYAPKEVLLNSQAAAVSEITGFIGSRLSSMITMREALSDIEADKVILNHFKEKAKDYDRDGWEAAFSSLAVLLFYLYETQKTDLAHINKLSLFEQSQLMDIDLFTRRNLELTETMRQKEKRGSLLWVLDKTKTAMGGRLLRTYIEQPLVSCTVINKRLNSVAELNKNFVGRQELIGELSHIYDIERIMTRIVLGSANARDLRSLCQTFSYMPSIKTRLSGFSTALMREIEEAIDPLTDITELIDRAIVEEPPFSVREGGIIKKDYHTEVDELRFVVNDGKTFIAQIEAEEKEKTGIKNLKIGFNKVFGYYIEVTRSYLEQVPETYIRKQTLANCERYITQELKELENKILSARERITGLEYELFTDIRNTVAASLHRIQATASAVAKLDVLCSFSETATKYNYVMPEVDYSNIVHIKDGRHPVVERMIDGSLFVANDTYLDNGDDNLLIITGPNMAGKSTYMRQVAVIVLMAQIGSFVPASYAKIGIVDKIFTRVGASDDLASGQSTFMVEMSEVANILKNATKKSLLIFDEIGRGTSTFDGMSIARAVLEYVADKRKLGAKSLFATHYHELTDLEYQLEGVKNYNVAVKKRGDDITFLRKIIRGGADDSYGIEVAKIAGIPEQVISRAKEILKAIEEQNPVPVKGGKQVIVQAEETDMQLSLAQGFQNEVMERLERIDVNVLSPIEALNLLYELKKLADR